MKQPDEFISATDKFMGFCKENQATVLFLVLGGLITAVGVGYFLKNQKIQILRMETLLHKMKKVQVKGADSGKLARYLNDFNEGIHKNRARMILGDAFYREKKVEEAIKIYEEILQNTGSEGLLRDLARFGLAQVHELNKDWKRAIAAYKKLLESPSSLPLFQVYFSLARVYEHEDDYKNALLTLREMENQFKDHAQYNQIVDKIKVLDKLT